MKLTSQRRIAARVLGVGINRVWLDPNNIDRVETALTTDDIRKLISSRVIAARPIRGVSRGRSRILHERRKLGRRRGVGSREGAGNARRSTHRTWVETIRAIRRRLQHLRDGKFIAPAAYRQLYRMSKGGSFRSVSMLNQYIKTSGLLRKKAR